LLLLLLLPLLLLLIGAITESEEGAATEGVAPGAATDVPVYFRTSAAVAGVKWVTLEATPEGAGVVLLGGLEKESTPGENRKTVGDGAAAVLDVPTFRRRWMYWY
jgi:hypothetical protein